MKLANQEFLVEYSLVIGLTLTKQNLSIEYRLVIWPRLANAELPVDNWLILWQRLGRKVERLSNKVLGRSWAEQKNSILGSPIFSQDRFIDRDTVINFFSARENKFSGVSCKFSDMSLERLGSNAWYPMKRVYRKFYVYR